MRYFRKILVPVDYSVNTDVAIAKAIQLSVPGTTSIELIHVAEPKKQHVDRLEELADTVARSSSLQTTAFVVEGTSVENAVIDFAASSCPQLIIIGKKNYHSFFPFLNTVMSGNIAEETRCPVLSVKPGSMNRKFERVVMPVSESFPSKKIELLATLTRNAELTVHLLTILNSNQEHNNHSASALLQSIKSIRGTLKCNIRHSIVHSNNKAIATLRYAEKILADTLLVSPETETTISTWIRKKDIADGTNPASQFHVLSVQPY